MVYEAVLVFAVLAIAISLFMFVTKWVFHHDLRVGPPANVNEALMLALYCGYLFSVVGLYFVWFWTHQGQTLAMKTWRIRLVARDGGPVSVRSAVVRYMSAWGWFLPAFGAAAVLGYAQTKGSKPIFVLLAANFAVWALAVYLDRGRQFLHDRLAGTRIVRTT
jgi:uncharacterized RDD family membrane protein YckC